MLKNEKGQAVAPKTVTMTKKDFEDQGNTRVYWLGGAGAMINDHGIVIMIDPLLEGFDMTLLIDMPIDVKDVSHVDAILVSHVDNDHYSRPTCRDLKDVCKEYHTSYYVASLMKEECGVDGIGHDIGDHIDRDNHEIVSAKIMMEDEKLDEFFNADEKEIIKQVIEDHRASKGKIPRSIYGKILASADKNVEVSGYFTRACSITNRLFFFAFLILSIVPPYFVFANLSSKSFANVYFFKYIIVESANANRF